MIRGVYGDNRLYVELAVRAFELWKEHEAKIGQRLYYRDRRALDGGGRR